MIRFESFCIILANLVELFFSDIILTKCKKKLTKIRNWRFSLGCLLAKWNFLVRVFPIHICWMKPPLLNKTTSSDVVNNNKALNYLLIFSKNLSKVSLLRTVQAKIALSTWQFTKNKVKVFINGSNKSSS